MHFKSFTLSALLLFSASAAAEITEQQIEADCVKIPTYARQGEREYQAKNYPKAREAFEQQVIWSESCALDDDAIATAYNNVALTLMREKQWRKARAWLLIRPDDRKSVYNLALIKDQLAALPRPHNASGEYWQYAGRASWNTLSLIKQQKPNTFQADFQGYYFGLMSAYYGPNMGEFSAPVVLKNGKGEIAIDEDNEINCTISLDVAPEGLTIAADEPDNCGFGANVRAQGHYLRVE
ncbi:TPA: tetratricopeptide repeat protein [Klebsiella aerogenes]|nr:tetratricopeptide repeat protein [Klebsiella aerogenes]